MRKTSIISIAIFLIIWILLIVSFAKSWYHFDVRANADEEGEWRSFINYYHDHINVQNSRVQSANGNYKYDEAYEGFKGYGFKSLAQAGLAFAVLAWIVTIAQIALSVADLLEFKLPPIGKFLGFVVFLFSLLSFLIFLGFPSRMRKDCLGNNDEDFCDDEDLNGYYHKSFIGHSKDNIGRWGPSSGWNCVVISCVFSLVGSIYNVLFFAKGADT